MSNGRSVPGTEGEVYVTYAIVPRLGDGIRWKCDVCGAMGQPEPVWELDKVYSGARRHVKRSATHQECLIRQRSQELEQQRL